jgi:hypothetical protein
MQHHFTSPKTLEEAGVRILHLESELASVWAFLADIYARPNNPDMAKELLRRIGENGTPVAEEVVRNLRQLASQQ